jgi:hypothetical protein
MCQLWGVGGERGESFVNHLLFFAEMFFSTFVQHVATIHSQSGIHERQIVLATYTVLYSTVCCPYFTTDIKFLNAVYVHLFQPSIGAVYIPMPT